MSYCRISVIFKILNGVTASKFRAMQWSSQIILVFENILRYNVLFKTQKLLANAYNFKKIECYITLHSGLNYPLT